MRNPLDVEHTTSCGHTWTMRHTACPQCFGELRAEVERLTNKLNADSQNFEIKCLSSEVERLKHLIFVWRQASYSGTPDEYQRAAVDLEDEALRISVVRAEPKHQEGSDD